MTDKAYILPGGDDFSRYGGATSQLPKLELTELDAQPSFNQNYAPSHPADSCQNSTEVTRPWYDPRGWTLRIKLIAGGVTVAIIILIVGAVEGTKKRNRYPDYKRLEYKLVEDYSGKSFFDKFDYFSEKDPTFGFVQ